MDNGELDAWSVFDWVPCPAMVLNRDLTIVTCNVAYEQRADTTRQKLVGRQIFEAFPGSDPRQTELLRSSFERVLSGGRADHVPYMQYATVRKDNSEFQERYWTVANIPLFNNEGFIGGILHCPGEITDLVHLTQSNENDQTVEEDCLTNEAAGVWTRNIVSVLQSERERLSGLFQQAPGFVCVLQGPDHIFELANDAYYQLVGHRRIIGQKVANVLPELVGQGFIGKLDGVYATGEPFIGRALPIELLRHPGAGLDQRFVDFIYQPMFDADRKVTGIFVQGSDVTDAYLLTQEVAYQAAHDSLTGLGNRREFARQTQGIAGPGPHALLYMDIDHFKIINDRCGHIAGDALLVRVADALQLQCDKSDDVLARLGGDEFALIRRNCSPEAMLELATRLRLAIKDLDFTWEGQRHGVTLSIGAVTFDESEGFSFEPALALADAACFLAKEKGRNRVQVSMLADEDIWRQQRDMDNVSCLKEAMREDRVIIYAQRIVSLRGDQDYPQGFYEILSRIRATDGSIIYPNNFISAAERFGIIEELDRHIITKVLSHIQANDGTTLSGRYYAINISGITLSAPGFCDFIEQSLSDYPKAKSELICFEVTETAAISDVKRTAEAMLQLTEKGFKFALDDFGSGMASFHYLHKLPVHFVKIDGEFVKSMIEQPASLIIVEAITKIAHTMNMRVIAESVESDYYLPILRELGVDLGQGYAFHVPEPL